MLLLAVLGCIGTIRTADGPETVRGALLVDLEDPTLVGFNAGKVSALIVANSELPCRAETVADDPATAIHEDDAAVQFWRVQISDAFAREGALVVGGLLYVGTEGDQLGKYPAEQDGLQDANVLVGAGRLAAAFWWHVTEAKVDTQDGVVLSYELVRSEQDWAVPSPAWIALDTDDGDSVTGRFDFTPTSLSGDFRATHCDNPEIATYAATALSGLLPSLLANLYAGT